MLTNGEHGGKRGVNRLVEQAVPKGVDPAAEGLYLPGLGGRWRATANAPWRAQSPGRERAGIAVPAERARNDFDEPWCHCWSTFCPRAIQALRAQLLDRIVLDNAVSPTLNINLLIEQLQGDTHQINGSRSNASICS